jgi:hypothetical protein
MEVARSSETSVNIISFQGVTSQKTAVFVYIVFFFVICWLH